MTGWWVDAASLVANVWPLLLRSSFAVLGVRAAQLRPPTFA